MRVHLWDAKNGKAGEETMISVPQVASVTPYMNKSRAGFVPGAKITLRDKTVIKTAETPDQLREAGLRNPPAVSQDRDEPLTDE